ncbi:DUF2735 domain-containing protein [Rhizobium sp. KVB221]|uniref:DUF2735 domain-containing protein n=1 Tax=Rhizobium setariae TaxID=2801340 RepID=A0A936YQI4_9HYPH|nr:DUF2735 domain-containing protein [Rhizobium setariae]MBL0370966.1 DUF2735 domain-containing protein [Rhizobium setariae]
MTTGVNRPSATIYQFPVGGRATLALGKAAEKGPTAPIEPVIYESAWYHEEAIKESDPKRPQ